MLNIEVDSELQSKATETLAKIGLSLEDAVNLFLLAAVRYGGLPFEDKLACYNDETLAAFKDAERDEGVSRSFTTVDELMKDLTSDD